jgi:hypothetical protein
MRLRVSLPSLGVSSLDLGPFNHFEWPPFFVLAPAEGFDPRPLDVNQPLMPAIARAKIEQDEAEPASQGVV